MNNLPDKSKAHLPAVAPDLLLVRWGSGNWQIQRVSERLATWLRIDQRDARGRLVDGLFPDAVPAVGELVAEVIAQGQDLLGIKLQLVPDQPGFVADIQFAGLTEDYLGQMVRVSLRAETLASKQQTGFRNLIGISPAMREVFRKIRLYAASDAAVIITGETGAGKELVAQALHEESPRANRPFAALNCAAISEQLLESELFGHDKGAFTGAMRDHRGYFERADGGSLFLDELGDMPLHTQTKLLRVLEDGKVQRVGSEKSHQVDVRFIGATNVPLEQAVADNRFRADLYHRLAVLRIHLPPLRERHEDIPLLANMFLKRFNERYGKGAKRLTSEAIRLLQSYMWPGNVRELRNVIERVVVETETEAISAKAFTEWIRERQQFAKLTNPQEEPADYRNLPVVMPYASSSHDDTPVYQGEAVSVASRRQKTKSELTEENIRRAYEDADGNLSEAARMLGVHRATLYRHLQRLNIDRNDLS